MAKKVKKTKAKITKKPKSYKLSKQNKIILGSLYIVASIFLTIAFISFYFTWKDDHSLLSEFQNRNEEAKNLMSKFGAATSYFFIYKGFGLASLIIPFLLALKGLYMFLGLDQKGMFKKWIWGLVFLIWI
jgi:S-DNA-T family DNA segregation ATPase FtsK/SpoIIIE